MFLPPAGPQVEVPFEGATERAHPVPVRCEGEHGRGARREVAAELAVTQAPEPEASAETREAQGILEGWKPQELCKLRASRRGQRQSMRLETVGQLEAWEALMDILQAKG